MFWHIARWHLERCDIPGEGCEWQRVRFWFAAVSSADSFLLLFSRHGRTLLLILTTWRNTCAGAGMRGRWRTANMEQQRGAVCRARQEKRSNFTCSGQFTLLCCIEIANGDQCYTDLDANYQPYTTTVIQQNTRQRSGSDSRVWIGVEKFYRQ